MLWVSSEKWRGKKLAFYSKYVLLLFSNYLKHYLWINRLCRNYVVLRYFSWFFGQKMDSTIIDDSYYNDERHAITNFEQKKLPLFICTNIFSYQPVVDVDFTW
jgi:hypothetical protein